MPRTDNTFYNLPDEIDYHISHSGSYDLRKAMCYLYDVNALLEKYTSFSSRPDGITVSSSVSDQNNLIASCFFIPTQHAVDAHGKESAQQGMANFYAYMLAVIQSMKAASVASTKAVHFVLHNGGLHYTHLKVTVSLDDDKHFSCALNNYDSMQEGRLLELTSLESQILKAFREADVKYLDDIAFSTEYTARQSNNLLCGMYALYSIASVTYAEENGASLFGFKESDFKISEGEELTDCLCRVLFTYVSKHWKETLDILKGNLVELFIILEQAAKDISESVLSFTISDYVSSCETVMALILSQYDEALSPEKKALFGKKQKLFEDSQRIIKEEERKIAHLVDRVVWANSVVTKLALPAVPDREQVSSSMELELTLAQKKASERDDALFEEGQREARIKAAEVQKAYSKMRQQPSKDAHDKAAREARAKAAKEAMERRLAQDPNDPATSKNLPPITDAADDLKDVSSENQTISAPCNPVNHDNSPEKKLSAGCAAADNPRAQAARAMMARRGLVPPQQPRTEKSELTDSAAGSSIQGGRLVRSVRRIEQPVTSYSPTSERAPSPVAGNLEDLEDNSNSIENFPRANASFFRSQRSNRQPPINPAKQFIPVSPM